MKIDFDELKLVLNAIQTKTGTVSSFELGPNDCEDKISREKLYFYLELLEDDNLIEVNDRIEQTRSIVVKRMTMSGFRTLEAMNNDTIWNKIKGQVVNIGIEGLKQIPSLAISLLVTKG